MTDLHDKATAAGRNWYYEGAHRAEEAEDVANRLALVAQRDALLAENERLAAALSAAKEIILKLDADRADVYARAEAAEARLKALCDGIDIHERYAGLNGDRDWCAQGVWLRPGEAVAVVKESLIPRPSMEGNK